MSKIRTTRDPAYGLAYNKIMPTNYLSNKQYSFDMARTPFIWRSDSDGEHVNVQGEVWAVNSTVRKVNKKLGYATKGIY